MFKDTRDIKNAEMIFPTESEHRATAPAEEPGKGKILNERLLLQAYNLQSVKRKNEDEKKS